MSSAEQVPDYLRCPCCFTGWGGVGKQYGNYNVKNRVYLRCDKCGHDWTADIVVTVEVLSVNKRIPEEITAR